MWNVGENIKHAERLFWKWAIKDLKKDTELRMDLSYTTKEDLSMLKINFYMDKNHWWSQTQSITTKFTKIRYFD